MYLHLWINVHVYDIFYSKSFWLQMNEINIEVEKITEAISTISKLQWKNM